MSTTIPIVSRVQEVVCIADVPYNFRDEQGAQRSGVTRKLCFLEFDSATGVCCGMFISKADPAFTCDLKRRGVLAYDRFGRVSGFAPLAGDD